MSTDMIWQTESTSSADTERLGELLGKRIKPQLTLELVGDLGAGKTSFVRGLARGFGSHDLTSSPSFSLSNIYQSDDGSKVFHFDLYRLGDNPGLLSSELAEALAEPNAVVVVEWGRSVAKLLPEDRLSLIFLPDPQIETKRRITIKYTESHRGLITKLETDWEPSRP